jgi:hypothetical protein
MSGEVSEGRTSRASGSGASRPRILSILRMAYRLVRVVRMICHGVKRSVNTFREYSLSVEAIETYGEFD